MSDHVRAMLDCWTPFWANDVCDVILYMWPCVCVCVAMCLEKRAFYRLISGMHASITIHLTAHYLQSGNIYMYTSQGCSNRYTLQIGSPSADPTFGPNFEEFKKRFDPQKTSSQGLMSLLMWILFILACSGPLWLKNLYFTYLLVLRAITKGEALWESESFFTDDKLDERIVKQTVQQIVKAAK